MAKRKKENPVSNFAITLYLKEYTSKMKQEQGIEATVSDFIDAWHEMQLGDTLDNLQIKSMMGQTERGRKPDEMMTSDNGIELMAGTMHIQAYGQTSKPTRPSTLGNRFRKHTKFTANVQPAGGSARDNIEYCSKPTGDWTYSDGKVKYNQKLSEVMWINEAGFNMVKGQRNDMNTAIRAIEQGASMVEIAEQYPKTFVMRERGLSKLHFTLKSKEFKKMRKGEVIVLYGKAGTGKSYDARHLITKQLGLTNDDVFSVQFERGSLWFDGYNGEKILLIDDYEPDQIKRSTLLKMTDRFAYNGQTKGGHIVAQWDYTIITSNYDIDELFIMPHRVQFKDENGKTQTDTHYIKCEAMHDRIIEAFCYDNKTPLRNKGNGYQVKMVTDSVAPLLPATLTHDTNRPTADCVDVTMRECEGATLTQSPQDSTLTQFDNLDTKQEELA